VIVAILPPSKEKTISPLRCDWSQVTAFANITRGVMRGSIMRSWLLSGVPVAVAVSLSLLGSSARGAGPGESADSLDLNTPVPSSVADVDFMTIYSGFEFVDDANFFYAGLLAALNGDLSRRGLLIQGFGGIGHYQYLNSAVSSGRVDAELTEASGLVGYQFFTGNLRFRAFGGVDWQNTNLSPPDPANPVSGSETDFVATADVETVGSNPLYFDLFGSYSITNQTYSSKARIGYNFGRVVVGPEGAFYGNENFNSQRAGAFLKFPLSRKLQVTLAGGFNFVANDEFFEELGGGLQEVTTGAFGGLGGITDSSYGNISITTWF
jgi:hypothetical protein